MDIHIPMWLVATLFICGGIGFFLWSLKAGSWTSWPISHTGFEPIRLALAVICAIIALFLMFG